MRHFPEGVPYTEIRLDQISAATQLRFATVVAGELEDSLYTCFFPTGGKKAGVFRHMFGRVSS